MIKTTEAYPDTRPQQLLFAFINRFNTFTEDEIDILMKHLIVKAFKKDTELVKAGEISTECYFVLEGCLRQYKLSDGTEQTIEFYTEEQAVVLFTSYTNQTKSDSYLVCLEDSILLVGDINSENTLYEKVPALQKVTRMMMEQDFGKTQTAFANFMSSTPEQRYTSLQTNRPDLIQRVAQHQLASYIGVTPESLSRIRKRIVKAQ